MTASLTARVCVVALVACAQAGGSSPPGDGHQDADPDADARAIDAPGEVVVDAAIDAPGATQVTLSQTGNETVNGDVSFACIAGTDATYEASWYRVFRLADAAITGGFRVTAVTFGVASSFGLPPVQIRVGTYAGAFVPPPDRLDTALITPLASATFTVPYTTWEAPTTFTVPITANVPALSQVIVEVFAPDLTGPYKQFVLGSTDAPETVPGYARAPVCGDVQPRKTTLILPGGHAVITVSGTH